MEFYYQEFSLIHRITNKMCIEMLLIILFISEVSIFQVKITIIIIIFSLIFATKIIKQKTQFKFKF